MTVTAGHPDNSYLGVLYAAHHRSGRAMLASAFILLALTGSAAVGQEPEPLEKKNTIETKVPDLENGLKIARTLCSSCHLIGEPSATVTPADVPSFASIANRPEQSTEKIANWLKAPHMPMPDPNLTRVEIRDLAGYILSLKP